MGAVCIDLCKRIEMPKPKNTKGFYKNGYKRCKYCEWWAKPEVLIKLGYGVLKCPCCKRKFKTKARKQPHVKIKIKVVG